MLEVHRRKQIAARVDQFFSTILSKQRWIMPEATGRREIHMRGGKQVGVVHPGGKVSIMHTRDIVHEYNEQGRLTERYRMGRPPEGYTLLSQHALHLLLGEYERLPRRGGMDNG